MCKTGRVWRAAACVAVLARGAGAQSTAQYRASVDSLATVWRRTVAAEAAAGVRRPAVPLPSDSARFGSVIVRADSGYENAAHAAAQHLAARVSTAYGAFGGVLARDQFVVKAFPKRPSPDAVSTGVVDSLGAVTQRSNVFANAEALESSWSQKVEEIVTNALDPSVRDWIGATIPLDPPTAGTWNRARVEVLFSSASVAHECADGNIDRCMVALELDPIENPAFVFLTPIQRRDLIVANARIIRRADPARFDRCADGRVYATCDSLIAMIPSDAVPRPVPPVVRQSLVQYALLVGGDGAFDRFAAGASPRQRLEAAARMPADSLVRRWRSTVFDARAASTAIDLTTATSSVVWIALCAGLALRSSRWR